MRSWDTSAFVKLYVAEPDSNLFQQLAAGERSIKIFAIARLEAMTVFRRREAEGVLLPGEARRLSVDLDDDVARGRVDLVPLSEGIEREFVNVLEKCFSADPPVFVRTNDALHVAAAVEQGNSDFISTDLRQRTAAALLGLIVLP